MVSRFSPVYLLFIFLRGEYKIAFYYVSACL